MPTVFTHAVTALALAPAARPPRPGQLWLLGMLCAVLPDFDVIAFSFGIPYEHMLGHRGITHSFVFAAALAGTVVVLFFRDAPRRLSLWLYFFTATASHALLDALTNGGLGVALFAPFTEARYFFPWRPIRVSPIGAEAFFTERGLAVLVSEFLWVWIPALVLGTLLFLTRRGGLRRSSARSRS